MDINPVDNPEVFATDSRSSVVIGAGTFLMTVPVTAVALRFYTRRFILNQVGADDWLSLGALFFVLATGITQCYMTKQGLGKHIGTLPQPSGRKNYMQNFYLSIVWYNASLLLVKLTFLAQYWRVLATQKMRRVCVFAMVIIGSWSFAQLMVGVFSCNPIQGFWDSSVAAFCLPRLPQWYINAAGNVITDIAIFLLPLPALGQLKLPRNQKFILIGIFSLGFVTCAISIMRFRYLHLSIDSTYVNVDGSLWSLSEICSGITCACLPTLRPLAPRWISGLPGRSGRTGRGYKRQGDSHTLCSDFVKDFEPGKGVHRPVSLTNWDDNVIYGQADYELQQSLNPDDSESKLGLRHTRESMSIEWVEHALQAPKPARAASAARWNQPSVDTRIESSVDRRSGSRYTGSAIQVQRDVILHEARLSLTSD